MSSTIAVVFVFVASSMAAATPTFEFVGAGCCKNSKGKNPSTATFAQFQNVQTLSDCNELCEAEPLCTAIEFSSKKLICEVHTSADVSKVTQNKKCRAMVCYRATYTEEVSATPAPTPALTPTESGQRACTMMQGVEFSGDTLKGKVNGIKSRFRANSPDKCAAQCLRREDCKQFTHLKNKCFLKGGRGVPTPLAAATSAICVAHGEVLPDTTATTITSTTATTTTTTTTTPELTPVAMAEEAEVALQLYFPSKKLSYMPEYVQEAQGGAVNGKLYVFGGFTNSGFKKMGKATYEYNPNNGKWNTKRPIPAAWTGATHMANAVDTETNTIYLLGGIANFAEDTFPKGSVGVADVFGFDAKNNKWTTLPSLPVARGGGASVVLDNKLHFFNGAEYDGANGGFQKDMADHWVLDLANTAAGWKTLASNSLGRNHVGGVVWGGNIYAIGGQFHEEEGCTNQKIAEVYNPKTNTWNRIADLPVGTGHISPATLAHEHGIIVVGGVTDTNKGCKPPGYARNQVYFYNPTTDTWTDLFNKHTGASMVSGIINGDVYAQHGNTVKRIELLWDTVGRQSAVKHTSNGSLNIDTAFVHASKSNKALLPAAVGGVCAVLLVVGALFATRRQTAQVPTDLQSLTTMSNVEIV
jgi:N-acetylneuraminic acid mutarotase